MCRTSQKSTESCLAVDISQTQNNMSSTVELGKVASTLLTTYNKKIE